MAKVTTDKTEEKPKESRWKGIPMSEKELKEWQKSFSDIEDSIKRLK